MSRTRERQQRKARLLSQIQQQRLDLVASRRDWLAVTRSYDRGWNLFLSLRAWVLVGGSLIALRSVRHPNVMLRWAKRGFGVWSTWRLVKSALHR